MSEVSQLSSRMPHLSTMSSFNMSTAPFGPVTTLRVEEEEKAIHAHSIVIIIIFSAVCFLLLLAFFYTFCFHCSIRSPPTDVKKPSGCSLDREDATYRCSSSEFQSVANIV